MLSYAQASVSNGFSSRLRTKLTSYTRKITPETLGTEPVIKHELS